MRKEKGLSAVEILIIIVILGILFTVAIPFCKDYIRRTKAAEARVMLNAIRTNQEQFYKENGSFAVNFSSLGNPTQNASYYTFNITLAGNNFTATATPTGNGTKAGLSGTWTMDKDGNFSGSAMSSGNYY